MENKDLERAVYMWFNMKYELYSRLEHNGSIYLYDDGKVFADIRVNRKSKLIYYKLVIYNEFSEIFPLKQFEFNYFMVKWVEDTFGLNGFTTFSVILVRNPWLKIPK